MRKYEVMVIFDPDTDDQAVTGVIDRVTKLLTDKGGEVSNVDRWGKRRLAFEIRKKAEGVYTVIEFGAEPAVVTEVERLLTLADEVIRHKVVKRAA
jgi:small subunit ribosomal protein S6